MTFLLLLPIQSSLLKLPNDYSNQRPTSSLIKNSDVAVNAVHMQISGWLLKNYTGILIMVCLTHRKKVIIYKKITCIYSLQWHITRSTDIFKATASLLQVNYTCHFPLIYRENKTCKEDEGNTLVHHHTIETVREYRKQYSYLNHQPRLMIRCPMSLLEIVAALLVVFAIAPSFATVFEVVVDEMAVERAAEVATAAAEYLAHLFVEA